MPFVDTGTVLGKNSWKALVLTPPLMCVVLKEGLEDKQNKIILRLF